MGKARTRFAGRRALEFPASNFAVSLGFPSFPLSTRQRGYVTLSCQNEYATFQHAPARSTRRAQQRGAQRRPQSQFRRSASFSRFAFSSFRRREERILVSRAEFQAGYIVRGRVITQGSSRQREQRYRRCSEPDMLLQRHVYFSSVDLFI